MVFQFSAKPGHFMLLTIWKSWHLLHIKGWRKGTGTEQVWEVHLPCSLLQFQSWWTNLLLSQWIIPEMKQLFQFWRYVWCPCSLPVHVVFQATHLPAETMRVVLERCYNDLRLLNVSSKTLKAEGFFRSNKVHALVFELFNPCVCGYLLCYKRHGCTYEIDNG